MSTYIDTPVPPGMELAYIGQLYLNDTNRHDFKLTKVSDQSLLVFADYGGHLKVAKDCYVGFQPSGRYFRTSGTAQKYLVGAQLNHESTVTGTGGWTVEKTTSQYFQQHNLGLAAGLNTRYLTAGDALWPHAQLTKRSTEADTVLVTLCIYVGEFDFVRN